MNNDEWHLLATAVNDDIAAMTRAAQTQSDVRDLLKHRNTARTEEQFIDEEAFDSEPGKPRIFQVAGASIKVWKVHRLGLNLSDVKGADLYYELGDRKFVLVQYKIPSSSDRVTLDDDQLQELKNACPVKCLPSNRYSCGAWYALRKTSGAMYFPACEARTLFGEYDSRKSKFFVNGLTKSDFQADFGECKIGARTQLIELNNYKKSAIDEDRIFVQATNLDVGRNVV